MKSYHWVMAIAFVAWSPFSFGQEPSSDDDSEGEDEELCLAEEAIASLNSASSQISMSTADAIYGLGASGSQSDDSGSDSNSDSGGSDSDGDGDTGGDPVSGWTGPNWGSCVGDLDLDVSVIGPDIPDIPDVDLPDVDIPDVDIPDIPNIPNLPDVPDLSEVTVCSMIGGAISDGLQRWGEFTTNNEYLGELGVSVSSSLEGANDSLKNYVQELNEIRKKYR